VAREATVGAAGREPVTCAAAGCGVVGGAGPVFRAGDRASSATCSSVGEYISRCPTFA
jgi:hypothetical protein